MSDIFENIESFSNSSKNLIAIQMNVDVSDIDNLPLLSEDFYLTDTEICFLRFDLDELHSHYFSLELSDPKLSEFIRSFSVLISDEKEHIIHGGAVSKSEISPRCDFLQDFVEHVTDINYPMKLFIYIETQNADFKNVKSAKTAEVEKSESNSYDKEQIACLQELSSDFKKIHEKEIGADVTLHAEGVDLKVHKIVLRVRAPGLNKMLKRNKSENTITIKDVRISIVRELVSFLYTGTKKSYDFDSARELYCLAAKFEIPSLRNVCRSDLLSHHIRKDNACQMLIFADQYRDVELEKEVMAFIKGNLKYIMDTRSFDDLSENHPKLALRMVCNHIRES